MVEDDSLVKGKTHETKCLFESPKMDLDLRWLSYCDDKDVPIPRIEMNVEELPDKDLPGPACTAEFELDEGQCVVFVLRKMEDGWDYASPEHEALARLDRDKVDSLAMDIKTLLQATSTLRPGPNPLLTIVSNEV